MMAITADGKIAKDKTQLTDWTSREDKKLFRETSKAHGVVIMGANTFRTFPSPLPDRLNVVFTKELDNPELPGVKWVKGDPEIVLEELEKLGFKSALLGGGAFLNTLFLEKKLISEIILTVEPRIFGSGLGLFDKTVAAGLKLLEVKKLNDDTLMLHYRVVY